MGITVDDFFENIYNVIFSPKDFFENGNIKKSIRVAIATVLLVYAINKISEGILSGKIYDCSYIASFILGLMGSVFLWFITSLFFEYCAKIFMQRDNSLEDILFYTAFAPMPYIFFAPLNFVKQIGNYGYIFVSIIEFLLYLWIIVLYAYAIRAAYKISFARSFMLILLPFISGFFAIYWLVCFFIKLGFIFSL